LLQALFDIGEKMERNLEAYIKTYKMLDEETCKQTIKEIEEIHWSQHTFYNVMMVHTEQEVVKKNSTLVIVKHQQRM
jgi:uncharacterized protein YbaP (TraB family)